MPNPLASPITKGMPILASTFEAMRKILLPLSRITVDAPLEMTQHAGLTSFRIAGVSPMRRGRTSSPISARTDNHLGTGTVVLYELARGTSRNVTALSSGVTVMNDFQQVIPNATNVILGYVDGAYCVLAADCPA